MSYSLEEKLIEIVGFVEKIPSITQRLDTTLNSARVLDRTIRDLAATLSIRDDIQTRSISILDGEYLQLQEVVAELSTSIDTVKVELLELAATLKAHIKNMQDLVLKNNL